MCARPRGPSNWLRDPKGHMDSVPTVTQTPVLVVWTKGSQPSGREDLCLLVPME